jgi:hypothetical protein
MRKILLKLSIIISGVIVIALPLQASALDRLVATFSNGNMYLKEGALTSPWHQLTSGTNTGNVSLAGNRIVLANLNNLNNETAVKEPNWDSPWQWAYWGQPFTSASYTSLLSDSNYRLVVLRNDGTIILKDGPWNTGWWSGTLTLPTGNLSNVVVGGDRMGVIMDTGNFYVKQLTPGQFSHPNNTVWQLEATGVANAKMTNSRIVYEEQSTGYLYGKDGDITAPWFGNHAVLYSGMSKSAAYDLGGNRLCAVKAGSTIECKEGGLGVGSKLTWNGGTDVSVSSNRIAVQSSDLINSWVLEGSVLGANSGWQWISSGGVLQVDMNNK